MTENEAVKVLNNFDMQASVKANRAYQSTLGEMACKVAVKALKEIRSYRLLGTVKECREAMERQKAKKPIEYKETNRADCPICGNTIRGISKPFGDWCSYCGQKLDWSE